MVLFLSHLAHDCSCSHNMAFPWPLNSQKKFEDTWVSYWRVDSVKFSHLGYIAERRRTEEEGTDQAFSICYQPHWHL